MPYVDYDPSLDKLTCIHGHIQPDSRIYLELHSGRRFCGFCHILKSRRADQRRKGHPRQPSHTGCVKTDYTGLRFGHILVLGLSPDNHGHSVAYWRVRCDCGNETVKQTEVLRQATKGKLFSCSNHCPYFIELARQRVLARKKGAEPSPEPSPLLPQPLQPEPLKPEPLQLDPVRSTRPKPEPSPRLPERSPRPKLRLLSKPKFQAASGNMNATPTSSRDSFPSLHQSAIGDGPGQWHVVNVVIDPAVDLWRYPTCDDDGDLSTSAIDKRATREHRRKLLAYPEPKESSPHEKIKDESKTQNSTQEKTDILCRAIFGNSG